MHRLTEIPRPFLVAVICETDPASISAVLESSARSGAAAVELNLAQIADRDLPTVRRIVDGVGIPVYTACRTASFMRVYGFDGGLPELDDQARVARQLDFLGSSCAADLEIETYGEPAIRAVRDNGGEVILSCHRASALSVCETIRLADDIRARGADCVKIVQRHDDPAHPAEIWKAAAALGAELERPFVLLSTGPGDMLLRRLACHFGCSYTFVRPPGVRHFYPGHPPLESMIALWKAIPPCEA